MKRSLLLSIALLGVMISQAQLDSPAIPRAKKPSAAFIKTLDNRKVKGWLYTLDDNQVVLVKSLRSFSTPPSEASLLRIQVDQIKQISLRKKNSGLKGALIGFGTGVLVGVVAGYASGDDKLVPYPDPMSDPFLIGTFTASIQNSFAMTAGEKALFGGIGCGITGAIMGAVIGSVAKKKFIIGGKKKHYRDLQGDLMRRLVVK